MKKQQYSQKNKKNNIVDSHSRDVRGKPSESGKSIILKFENFDMTSYYIADVYCDERMVSYELQFLQVDTRTITQVEISSTVQNHKSESQNAKCLQNRRNYRHKKKTKCKIENAYLKPVNKNKQCPKPMPSRMSMLQKCVDNFLKKVTEGPVYVCVVCNRSLYKKSVKVFKIAEYVDLSHDIFQDTYSFDGIKYVCLTCSKKAKKKIIPCQAVWNKLQISDIPEVLSGLNKLEVSLISKRLLFKKIAIMGKGQMPKLKGAICNVPVSIEDMSISLPRCSNTSGIILVKLKKRLVFDGHVYFEPVSPLKINNALIYLKQNNKFYEDITINIDILPPELLNLDVNEEILIEVEKNQNVETMTTTPLNIDKEIEVDFEKSLLDNFRIGASEICLLPSMLSSEYIEIAPGEGKTPKNIMLDENCEELAFPNLICTGEFGYKVEREVKLSPVKYFNSRLLNYKQVFSSSADYIFFVQFVLQQQSLNSQINIAMRKVSGSLTAGMLSQNFKEVVNSFVAQDQCFLFMNNIKGTPAFWKRFQLEVLAMIRQLGCPRFF